MEIKRREIFIVDLNPVIGTGQAGLRPAFIIQIDKANKASPHTIIIPFTTKIREVILPSHVKIPKDTGGLLKDSVLLCEQIRVIDKKRLIKKIGDINNPEYLNKIHNSIKTILGL